MLRATTNHIYRVSDLLGRGVSSNVYKGVDKKTGQEHALKVFNVSLSAHMNDALKREVDALKSLSHPNVVTFLNLERDVSSGHQVIVMEICTGGTLLTVLAEPQHGFGLTEDEFLLFFSHVVAGLKHLRLNGFVHRDIKPGNILRSIGEDGKSVYKLSDFGSAKKLDPEEEQFMSMYGTEEYLHPDIFEKAFIDRSVVKQFTLAVDLWSIGATLYHAAAGSVPFRPYGGRKNKETMFQMIAQKATGVISGVQESPKGEITWSKELPATCSLSADLKTAVTEMCAGTLERNAGNMWSFDTFFCESERLFEKVRVFVFSTADCSAVIVYINPKHRLAELQKQIERHLKVEPDKQILYWGEKPLSEHVTKDTEIGDFPKTSTMKPIILFPSFLVSDCELSRLTVAEFPKIPDNGCAIEDDFRDAKHCLEVLYNRQSVMDQCRMSQKHLCEGAAAFRSHIISDTVNLKQKVERELTVTHQLQQSVDLCLRNSSKSKEEIEDRITYDFGERESETGADKSRDILISLNDGLSEILVGMETSRQWCLKTLDEVCSHLTSEKALETKCRLKLLCQDDCECVTRPKWQIKEVRGLLQKFDDRRRHAGRLAYHEEQLHAFDRRHLADICEKSHALLNDHCLPANCKVFDAFNSWHRVYLKKSQELDSRKKAIHNSVKTVGHIQAEFLQLQAGQRSQDNVAPSPTQGTNQIRSTSNRKKEKRREMFKALETSLCETSSDSLSLREEMASLQESLHSMAETLKINEEPEKLSFEDVLH